MSMQQGGFRGAMQKLLLAVTVLLLILGTISCASGEPGTTPSPTPAPTPTPTVTGTPTATPTVPGLEVLSIPDIVNNGDDFEIIIKTVPFANCRIYIPMYAVTSENTNPLFDKYVEADADGLVTLYVPINENPFYWSDPPDGPPSTITTVCIISSNHPDYPQTAETEVDISFQHWNLQTPHPPIVPMS